MSVDFWNTRYAEQEFAYGTEPNRFLREQLPLLTPGAILFPAEGEGRNAVFAAGLGWTVTAFDQSLEGKSKALALAARKGVTIDYTVAPWDSFQSERSRFDAAALIFVHMPEHQRALFHHRVLDLLKPGGVLLLEGFSKDQLQNSSGGPKDAPLLFSVEMLQKDFGQGMDLTLLEQHEYELKEGTYHNGTASVVRMVGRKR
jgi:SAM-dependent methyltransferase